MSHNRERYWREKQKRTVQRLHELVRKRQMYETFMGQSDPVLDTTIDHAAEAANRATDGLERAT